MEPLPSSDLHSTWEWIAGARLGKWIETSLEAVQELARLRMVEGDATVRDMMEDLDEDISYLLRDWRQSLAMKGHLLERAWLLDERAVQADMPEGEVL